MSFTQEEGGGLCSPTMRLTLRYTLSEPSSRWIVALVTSPLVQGILRSRMVAGMKRFATTMRREHGGEGMGRYEGKGSEVEGAQRPSVRERESTTVGSKRSH